MRVHLVLSSGRITRWLSAIVALLMVAHLVGWLCTYVPKQPFAYELVRMFDLGAEDNVPTWVSSGLLAIASLLLAMIGLAHTKQDGRLAWAWFLLAAVFVTLSLDEVLEFHDRLSTRLEGTALATGIFYYAWVVPYGIACAVLLTVLFPFLKRLPSRIRRLFIVAGLVYVGGALGIEMIQGALDEVLTWKNWYSRTLIVVEEVAEMGGVVLFIYALLEYMRSLGMEFMIRGEDSAHVSAGRARGGEEPRNPG